MASTYSLVASFFNRVTGSKGCKFQDNAAGTTAVKFSSFIAQEDTTFTAITGSNGTDLMAYFNLTGKTIKQGALFTAPLGEHITVCHVATGSVIGYNE
jgi:hypothetical protein